MDVDGTMTDGRLFMTDGGELFKIFDVKDGMGVKKAFDNGLKIAIISGKKSGIVEYRAKELKIKDCYLGVVDKVDCIKQICNKYGYAMSEIAYIGDDINDIPILESVGLSFVPFDATPEAKKICDIILNKSGGHGAVRECIDYILDHNYNQGD